MRGSDAEGWVVEMVLEKFDEPDATATLPMDTEGLERHLESTVLMPTEHEEVRGVVQSVIGRGAGRAEGGLRLARYVHERSSKRSPEVAQASALEILESGTGDCSEHALLFVTLCRAAGIPARQCSGYVCIGSQWGAHAWTEIWLGRWVGADPTTGEIGTGARYVFFGYHDDPDSYPGPRDLAHARPDALRRDADRRGRGRLRPQRPRALADLRRDDRRYVHVLAGLEARDVPRDWVVRLSGGGRMLVRGADFRVEIRASADQGMQLHQLGIGGVHGDVRRACPRSGPTCPAAASACSCSRRRRLIQVFLRTEEDVDEILPRLEAVLAPTFAPVPAAGSGARGRPTAPDGE